LRNYRDCVGTLKDGYVCNIPLPKAPRKQSASHVTSHGAVMCNGSTPLNSTPRVNSTPLHSTRVGAASRIQSGGHVTSHGPITRDNVHSTQLQSTCVCAAPQIRSGGHVTSHGPITRADVPEPDTCYLQFPRIPMWSDLIGSLTGLGRCPRIIPFSPVWLG
jgi:hypothetical protein